MSAETINTYEINVGWNDYKQPENTKDFKTLLIRPDSLGRVVYRGVDKEGIQTKLRDGDTQLLDAYSVDAKDRVKQRVSATWRDGDREVPVTIIGVLTEHNGEKVFRVQEYPDHGIPESQLEFTKQKKELTLEEKIAELQERDEKREREIGSLRSEVEGLRRSVEGWKDYAQRLENRMVNNGVSFAEEERFRPTRRTEEQVVEDEREKSAPDAEPLATVAPAKSAAPEQPPPATAQATAEEIDDEFFARYKKGVPIRARHKGGVQRGWVVVEEESRDEAGKPFIVAEREGERRKFYREQIVGPDENYVPADKEVREPGRKIRVLGFGRPSDADREIIEDREIDRSSLLIPMLGGAALLGVGVGIGYLIWRHSGANHEDIKEITRNINQHTDAQLGALKDVFNERVHRLNSHWLHRWHEAMAQLKALRHEEAKEAVRGVRASRGAHVEQLSYYGDTIWNHAMRFVEAKTGRSVDVDTVRRMTSKILHLNGLRWNSGGFGVDAHKLPVGFDFRVPNR